MSRPRLTVLALTAVLLVPLGRASHITVSAHTGRFVTRLVLLNTPTRWDAWASAAGTGPDARRRAGLAATPRLDARGFDAATVGASRAAADRAGRESARMARLITDVVHRAGGNVLARYDTALPGLLVRLPVGSDAAIATLPGVRRVAPAPYATLHLRDSVPATGARRVVEELGIDGAGTTIAIADSGIDYTHAAFGGPGSEEAYEAAAASAERIDDTYVGEPLFPSARVIGGWDFAGRLYDPDCTPTGELTGRCSATPRPDPDPLDKLGHGTIVAGTAAGQETGTVGPGVAPGVGLVALKIFGLTGSTALLVDAIEWAIEANMGVANRPHIDVLNLSLGVPYGSSVLVEEGVIRRAVEAGIVVVASAGNDRDLPFIVAAPATAPEALAVASHTPPGRHIWEAELVSGGQPEIYDGEAVAHQGWSPDPRSEFGAPVVFIGRGCPGDGVQPQDPYLVDPAGAIAMFEMAWGSGGPACTVDRQARRAQEAGALGALMATTLGVEMASPFDAPPTVDIPVWMVNSALESAIAGGAARGVPMHIALRPVPIPELDGVINTFSSRGPARTGWLKPNLSAPGSGIYSAAVGQGRRGVSSSGTSLSAPHVSGAAALVWANARAKDWRISARDVGAILVNTADPYQVLLNSERREAPALAQMGAGGLDSWSAVGSHTVVRAGPISSLNLGFRALAAPAGDELTLDVTNLSAVPRRYQMATRYRGGGEAGLGLAVSPTPPDITVAPGATERVTVSTRIYPNLLPPWTLSGGAQVSNSALLADCELDGWLELREAASDGASPPDSPTLRVPFYALPRRASRVTAEWAAPPREELARGGSSYLRLANDSPFPGVAELFHLVATDPYETDLPSEIDLDAMGVRATPDRPGGGGVAVAPPHPGRAPPPRIGRAGRSSSSPCTHAERAHTHC